MIGCVFYTDSWHCRQWFLDDVNDEKEMLSDFLHFANSFHTLLHFNGTTFDIPFVRERSKKYAISQNLDSLCSIDLYKLLRPLKKILSLPSAKQKAFESFLQIDREDQFDGGLLIEVYEHYLETHEDTALHLLTIHNLEDIENLVRLLDLLPLRVLFSKDVDRFIDEHSLSANLQDSRDYKGQPCKRLTLHFCLKDVYHVSYASFHMHAGSFFLTYKNGSYELTAISENGEFHLFYPDYKQYYYLPLEDEAIHKSLASYVDKDHRQKATADNCYTRFFADTAFLDNSSNQLQFVTHTLIHLGQKLT